MRAGSSKSSNILMSKDMPTGLNRLEVFVFGFGAMIGWGWVILAGNWINHAGSVGAILAFIIGGIMIYVVSLTYAELASALPESGGVLNYGYKGIGKTGAFICTWSILLSYVSVISFETTALPVVFTYLIPSLNFGYVYSVANSEVYWPLVVIGIVGAMIIMVINIRGTKVAMRFQSIMIFMMLTVGIFFAVGILKSGSTTNMQPLFSDGINGLIGVTMVTPFLYLGFEVIPQLTSEMSIPLKKIGQILIISVLAAIIWYALIIFGVSNLLTKTGLLNSDLPAADAMGLAFGNSTLASNIMLMAGLAGIVTSWNSFFAACAHIIAAMAERGLLPQVLAKKHAKYDTPYVAMLLIGAISMLSPFFGRNMLAWLSNAGSFGCIVCNGLIALCFIRLRKTEPHLERPFKVKYARTVGVLAITFSFILFILFLPWSPAALSKYEWGIVIFWTVIGFVLFRLRSKK